jgi:drug/metabolite transporter (DMT)-like permease
VPPSLLVFPLFAAFLLLLSARARRALDVLAPLQFATIVGGAIIATQAAGAQGVSYATTGVLVAMSGLVTTVLRKERLAHQSAYRFDWEKFELDFRFYAITERLWRR